MEPVEKPIIPAGLSRNELTRSAKKAQLQEAFKHDNVEERNALLDKLYGPEPEIVSTVIDKRPISIDHVIHTTVAFADAEWVRFDGSQERMYFGPDHSYTAGQRVKITIEKEPEPNAITS